MHMALEDTLPLLLGCILLEINQLFYIFPVSLISHGEASYSITRVIRLHELFDYTSYSIK
jgi:hypothetical protein